MRMSLVCLRGPGSAVDIIIRARSRAAFAGVWGLGGGIWQLNMGGSW